MEPKPASEPSAGQPESEVNEVPRKKNPHKAAGSLDPKERNVFYEAVVRKGKPNRKDGNRKRV